MPDAMHAKGFAWLEPAITIKHLMLEVDVGCRSYANHGVPQLSTPAVRTVDVLAFCSWSICRIRIWAAA